MEENGIGVNLDITKINRRKWNWNMEINETGWNLEISKIDENK